MPTYQKGLNKLSMEVKLILGNCLEKMKDIPDGSVDLVLTDPPYGTVRGIGGESVKHGMVGKTEWDTAIEQKQMLEECNRVLRMNGALVLFSQEPYTSKLVTETHGNLPFSYRMVWKKDHFANALIAKVAPVSYYEDICVFFKVYDTAFSHPLHDYAARMLLFIGKPRKEIYTEMEHQGAFHWFLGKNSIQFELCTEKTYDELKTRYRVQDMSGFMEYADLARIDLEWRRSLQKTFNLPIGEKFVSNVLEYKKDYTGFHPTQKPLALMEMLIKTYSNEENLVLDFAMGSGTTGVACRNLNRNFVGIELDPTYFEIAKNRIRENQGTEDTR
jgi:site-specific DNA-methyltransferase (adenine-specific)